MRKNKVWFVSVVGAAIAGLACIAVPLAIILFGSSAIALVPSWLDYVLVPVFLVLTVISVYYWYRNRSSTES